MCLNIDSEVLRQAGLSDREALTEFACRLYQADRLSLPMAARLCGLERVAFENELRSRGLAVYTVTREDFEADLRTLKTLESRG